MQRKDIKIYILFTIIILFLFSTCVYFFYKDYLVLLMILYLIMISLYCIYRISRNGLFDISALFTILFTLYNLNIPFAKAMNVMQDNSYYLASDYNLVFKFTYVGCIVPIFFFIIGNEICKSVKPRKNDSGKTIEMKYNSAVKFFVNITEIAGLVIFVLGIYQLGGIAYLKEAYVWNLNESSKIGVMTTGYQLFCCAVIIKFYYYLDNLKQVGKKLNFFKWKDIYILAPVIFIKLFQGARIQTLIMVLSMIIVYNYKYKKINVVKLLAIGFSILIIFGLAGFFRNIKSFNDINLNELENYAFGQSQNAEFFLNSYTNLTTLFVINNYDVKYLNGLGIFDGFIYILPRFIVSNKDDLLATSKWTQIYSYYQVISPVGGLNIIAQLFMNGYIFFEMFFMMFFGYISNYIYKKYVKYRVYDTQILLYSLVIPFIIVSFIRNPMYIFFKEIVEFAIIPYLIIYKLKNI